MNAIYYTSSLSGVVRSELPEIRGFVMGSVSGAREITYRITGPADGGGL